MSVSATRRQTFIAASGGPSALVWPHQPLRAKVLHVFEEACNLVREDGAILSLVSENIGNGPFNLVGASVGNKESHWPGFPEFVQADSPVYSNKTRLIIGRMIVDFSGVKLWSPRPSWERLSGENLIELIPMLFRRFQIESHQESLVALLYGDAIDRFQRAADKSWRLLAYSISRQDIEGVKKSVGQMAGLGGGLTPAADDFLMGVVYALWAVNKPKSMSRMIEVIVDSATSRTTKLSAAWLRASGQGQASETWHDLVEGLSGNSAEQKERAIEVILKTGHTSGADTLAGFTANLQNLLHSN
jgi:hypothetical protein